MLWLLKPKQALNQSQEAAVLEFELIKEIKPYRNLLHLTLSGSYLTRNEIFPSNQHCSLPYTFLWCITQNFNTQFPPHSVLFHLCSIKWNPPTCRRFFSSSLAHDPGARMVIKAMSLPCTGAAATYGGKGQCVTRAGQFTVHIRGFCAHASGTSYHWGRRSPALAQEAAISSWSSASNDLLSCSMFLFLPLRVGSSQSFASSHSFLPPPSLTGFQPNLYL